MNQGDRILECSEIEQAIQNSRNKREKYWLEHILAKNPKITVFICGAEHIDTFPVLARKKGCDTDIIVVYYEKAKYDQNNIQIK